MAGYGAHLKCSIWIFLNRVSPPLEIFPCLIRHMCSIPKEIFNCLLPCLCLDMHYRSPCWGCWYIYGHFISSLCEAWFFSIGPLRVPNIIQPFQAESLLVPGANIQITRNKGMKTMGRLTSTRNPTGGDVWPHQESCFVCAKIHLCAAMRFVKAQLVFL